MTTLPAPARLYRALAERDSGFEGVFFAAVRTTGVFCRPTCPARKPRPENVEYFATSRDAVVAGYRPCKRCRPLDAAVGPPEIVVELLDLARRAAPKRVRDADLRGHGIDASTARRAFLAHFGLTFQQFQRAQRLGAAFDRLQQGERPQRARDVAGYASESGFDGAFSRLFGAPPGAPAAASKLVAQRIATPLGTMLAVAGEEGLWLLEFADRRALPAELRWIRRRCSAAIVPGTNRHLRSIERELGRYFAGESFEFRTPVMVAGTPFQEKVWAALRAVAPGETRSYAELAAAAGSPGAARAVGKANGDNRLSLVVPCHRVIRSDGTLCGYGGGVWRKRWLLAHEGAAIDASRRRKSRGRS